MLLLATSSHLQGARGFIRGRRRSGDDEVDEGEGIAADLPDGTTGGDYLTQAPATVYESEQMSPQNMDYDATNKMFVAHACWYNDRLVHYYKFRM